MRYIDSGTRDAANAVATWLNDELNDQVFEFRIQSGFFSRDALRPFLGRLEALLAADGLISVVVGSNDGQTLSEHVLELVQGLGLPRERSRLGIVYLSGAYFHPKTFHIRRVDGSQAAYVGSANFTLPGIAAKHVEAGLLLDSREGDSVALMNEIAFASDAWFNQERAGIERIFGPDDVAQLLANGIISAAPSPRPPRPGGVTGQPPARPTLAFLVNLVQPAATAPVAAPALAAEPEDQAAEDVEPALEATVGPAVVQHTPPYPPYMYFAPNAQGATYGLEALTGASLGDAAGLIVRLSRDNDRHWRNAVGTANLSVPVSTASTIRFGFYGTRSRPRADFDLMLRYIDNDIVLIAEAERAGLQSFGYTPGDTGHGDLRLVIPKPPVAELREQLIERGLRLPRDKDLAILEWPTPTRPHFSMTVTHPESILGQQMQAAWQNAVAEGEMASRGACWLPAGLTPAW